MNGSVFRALLAVAAVSWGIAIFRRFRRISNNGAELKYRRWADAGSGLIAAGICTLGLTAWPGLIDASVEKVAGYTAVLLFALAPFGKSMLSAHPFVIAALVFITVMSALLGLPLS